MRKQTTHFLCLCLAASFLLTAAGCGSEAIDSTTSDTSDEETENASTSSEDAADTDADSEEDESSINGESLSAALSGDIGVTPDEDDYNDTYDSYDAEITLADDATTVTGDTTAVTIDGNTVQIDGGGTFYLTGTLSDGQIYITGDSKTKLYLDGVSVTNADGPALLATSEKRTILSVAADSENTFADASGYTNTTVDDHDIDPAAIYVQDKLTINGAGTLTVTGNCDTGILCKDDLLITGATTVVTAVGNGIKGKDCVATFGGTIEVTAENDGIKSTNDEDSTKGYLQLEDGDVTITAGGDCLQAETLVWISGGTYTLTAENTSYDEESSSYNSSKGIKCAGDVQISGGTVTIDAIEDGIHCDGAALISDGTVNITTEADGVQAEGDLTQTGGDVNITTTGVLTSSGSDNWNQDGGGMHGGFGMDYTTGGSAVLLSQITQVDDTTETEESGSSSKGVKCTGDLVMSGGTCAVTSTDHAVHATGSGTFSGATLDLYSDKKGISTHGNLSISDGDITIEYATEGIESKAEMVISGGEIHILDATDDGLNTGGQTSDSHDMTISGGYIYLVADGDGIDSNGALDITGGTIVACGPTDGSNGSVDFGTSMSCTGGVMLALSNNGMMEYGSSGLLVTTSASISAGELVTLCDADGNVLLAVETPKAVSDIIAGIGSGDSDDYVLYAGGTCSTDLNDDGVATSGTLSGGSEVSISTSSGGNNSSGGHHSENNDQNHNNHSSGHNNGGWW